MRALPGQASRLPPGPRPITREEAAAHQRRRILQATAELVGKRGYPATTTELIVRRAKVGYATFYKNFADKEECFLALFDDALDRATQVVGEAFDAGGDAWPEQATAALAALFELIDSDPSLARACLVESLGAGPAAQQRYDKAVRRLAGVLRPGRGLAPNEAELPDSLEDTLAGGILWSAYERLTIDEADHLGGLLRQTLEFSLSPYIGQEEAARIAEGLGASPPERSRPRLEGTPERA